LLKEPLAQPASGPAILLDAGRAFIPLDAAVARETFLDALDMYLISYSFTEGTTGVEIARAALEFLETDTDDARTEYLLLDAVASLIGSGYVASVPALRRVADAFRNEEISGDDLLKWSSVAVVVEIELFDDEAYRMAAARLEAVARENGALGTLPRALLNLATLDTQAGWFGRARERYTEAVEVTALTGGYAAFYELLDVDLLAWCGDDELTRSKARQLEQWGAAVGSHATVYMAWLALAVLELGQGNYRQAFEAARRIGVDGTPVSGSRALPFAIEAAARCGETAAATEALDRLAERARASGVPSALGLLARSQALLAGDDDAEALYRRAVDLLATTHWKTELARSHLVYGEWLRRTNRRLDARVQLRTAHDMFAGMGAQAFAERARMELAASGERARKRTVETAQDLTAQEMQVARLAAERATSREIAAQLFISSKTVEYHLGKVFRKLGVSSRRDLAAALPLEIARAGSAR
jgi:DNA-binding CsgD family transcriptional regulator